MEYGYRNSLYVFKKKIANQTATTTYSAAPGSSSNSWKG